MTKQPKRGIDGRYVAMVEGKRFSRRANSQREANEMFAQWMAETFDHPSPTIASEFPTATNNIKVVAVEHVKPQTLAEAIKPKRETLALAVEKFVALKQVSKNKLSGLKAHLSFLTSNQKTIELSVEDWERLTAAIRINIDNETWSDSYANDLQNTMKAFFRWTLDTERVKKLPAAMDSKLYTIKRKRTAIKFFSAEQWQQLMTKAEKKDQELKLMMQLMLNTGSTQEDLNQLDWSQIDLEAGTLTRKRTKHAHRLQENIPTVQYHLWPEIIAALKQRPSQTGMVFVRADGSKLIKGRDDTVAKRFNNIKFDGLTLKHIRKTGATTLGKSLSFRGWRELYLANAPQGTTDIHYDGTTELPVEVTNHIRQELGL